MGSNQRIAKRKPTYIAIEEALEKDISEGIYRTDTKLPTERELMEKYNVSRMTIRQVISNLTGRGLVYRVKGKGAFVQKEIFFKSQAFSGFVAMMAERGITVETRLLDVRTIIPEELVRLKLNMDEFEAAYMVKRVRITEDSPIAVVYNYVPCKLFPKFDRIDFNTKSIYQTMETDYQADIGYQKEIVSAVPTPPDVTSILYDDQETITYALKIENLVMSNDSQPLMLGVCYFNPERYSYFNVSMRK